jgi:hypothetical protein
LPALPASLLDGKEGVDGSSPSEGSAKAAEIAAFFCRLDLHELQYAVGMEPVMDVPVTQLYDDVNSPEGYFPTFLLAS